MGQQRVITVDSIADFPGEERRPGCVKGVLQEEARVQTAVFHVKPGSGVPAHLHSRVFDLFVGIRGTLEILYSDQQGNGCFQLKAGAFCAMPPGVRHEVRNVSNEDASFFIVHAPHDGYDFVPVTLQGAILGQDG